MSVFKDIYGEMDGKAVHAFTIRNSKGSEAVIIEKGATLDKLIIADKNGVRQDVLSGFDDLDSHIHLTDNQGVTVGQYANRIANGRFTLDGKEYQLTLNEKGKTCLHGGGEYSSALWSGEKAAENAVSFSYFSPDMKDGFPGNVTVKVTFTFSDDDELSIKYYAVSDKKTVINLTNHAYFNLNGYENGDILSHELKLNASRYTPIDTDSIPLGTLDAVEGTPFDFTSQKKIGRDISEDDEQLINGNGYDHNFCIDGADGTLRLAAEAVGDISGIRMKVFTTLPGIQLYTGNFLDGTVSGKGGVALTKRCSFCLETQVYPDTPNHPEWPSCVYDANEEYKSETVFAFSID